MPTPYLTHIAPTNKKKQDEENAEKFEAPSNAIKLKYELTQLGCIKLAEATMAPSNAKSQWYRAIYIWSWETGDAKRFASTRSLRMGSIT
jgi:hypothetical protein